MNMDHTLFDLVDLYVYPDISDIIMTYVAELELLERVRRLNEEFELLILELLSELELLDSLVDELIDEFELI